MGSRCCWAAAVLPFWGEVCHWHLAGVMAPFADASFLPFLPTCCRRRCAPPGWGRT